MGFWQRSLLVLGSGCAGAYVLVPYDSPPRRVARTLSNLVIVGADYKILNWRGLNDDNAVMSVAHERNAKRIYELCAKQGGIFTKFGQHVSAADRAIPSEYKKELSRLQDQATAHTYREMRETFKKELGMEPEDVFSRMSEKPIASASLAQVYKAKLKEDGAVVAVKMQHPRVRDSIPADLFSLRMLTNYIIPYLFDGLNFNWLVTEFEKNLGMELNFNIEADNAKRASAMFVNNPYIKIPNIYSHLSSERVLTMEFIEGVKISDLNKLQNVSAQNVADTLTEAFAQMVYVEGFLHGDPHEGNLLVQPDSENSKHFKLVLLDHGLYRELDDRFRVAYCKLWKALVSRSHEGVVQSVSELGVPGSEDIFSFMLVHKSLSQVQNPRATLGEKPKKSSRPQFQQNGREWTARDFSNFIEALPRDLLLVMRTNNLVSGLVKKMNADVDRFTVNARYAVRGLHAEQKSLSWLRLWQDSVQLESTIMVYTLAKKLYDVRGEFSRILTNGTGEQAPLGPVA
eukprot:Plantae.Rhodophyta-Purpureofilum_apyrenoidigerum.ctg7509.p1 GENE.Plantae.Rhodophyta-Purpureofilum_apyrenoidigerum.ctg7509~~Plantae.Rhodophyta-Purpureofilum_apyrenoidigerum.ctg7509.p1  ORF type:complete len:514 (+),score=81.49 Plantae.Rhodophyta-Purpureofilum_apyrenoidigerum.ctg7509:154-1695(+)